MINIYHAFLIITTLFFVLLFLKSVTKKDFCVICLSFSLTWVYLLFLLYTKAFSDALLLGIFMGQTSIGIYYVLERKLNKRFHIFRLPFLLSLTLLIYTVLNYSSTVLSATKFTLAIWAIFILIFVYRKNPKARKLVKKIIECCKRW